MSPRTSRERCSGPPTAAKIPPKFYFFSAPSLSMVKKLARPQFLGGGGGGVTPCQGGEGG